MSEVYYGTAVLIGYRANWKTLPTMQFVGDSEIAENEFGDEDRISNWHHFRQQIFWLVSAFGRQERGRVIETLRIARDKKLCACPSWLEHRCISDANGLQGVLSDEPDFDWHAGKHLWYGLSDGSYGIVRIKSIDGTSIEIFDDGVELSKGMWVAPMIVGRLVSGVPTTDSSPVIRDLEITVCESGGNENGLIRKVQEYLALNLETTAESGIRHLDPETISLSTDLDSIMETLAITREDPNSSTLGIDISASLDTIVFPRSAYESATVGIDISATLETVES